MAGTPSAYPSYLVKVRIRVRVRVGVRVRVRVRVRARVTVRGRVREGYVPLLRLEQQPALREQRVVLRCRRQQAAPVALERSGARSGRVASCWVVRRWGARELHDS